MDIIDKFHHHLFNFLDLNFILMKVRLVTGSWRFSDLMQLELTLQLISSFFNYIV